MESLATWNKMMKAMAHVRRDGRVIEIPAEEIVSGDLVLFEAGDRASADGRPLLAATLEIEKSALTGESTPVPKDTVSIVEADVPQQDSPSGHSQAPAPRSSPNGICAQATAFRRSRAGSKVGVCWLPSLETEGASLATSRT